MARRIRLIIAFAGMLSLVSTSSAGNWPHWRGPEFYGVSDEKDLPTKWSHEENITWKVALPALSGATPIIWGDRIFLNVAESGNLQLWCVDRNKAAVSWKKQLSGGDEKRRKQNMSSPSPVTDGKTVWVITGTGVLKAFDFAGAELWGRDIQKDYGKFGLNHGYASSPFLLEGDLIVQVLHGMLTDDPSYILRIDGKTGKTKWRVERPTDAQRESPDSYTTPALFRQGQTAQIIITGGDYVTGHDPATGKELWRASGLNPEKFEMNRIIASPVVFGDMFYVPTRRKPLQAFRLPTPAKPERIWAFDAGPDVPTPVTDGKYLYSFDDRGIAHCLNAKTGETVWGPERIPSATYSASPVLADGKLYMSSEEGLTTVVRAGPKFEVLAQNQLDGYTLSSPAISDGQIFLRTANWLYCVGKRRTGGPSD